MFSKDFARLSVLFTLSFAINGNCTRAAGKFAKRDDGGSEQITEIVSEGESVPAQVVSSQQIEIVSDGESAPAQMVPGQRTEIMSDGEGAPFGQGGSQGTEIVAGERGVSNVSTEIVSEGESSVTSDGMTGIVILSSEEQQTVTTTVTIETTTTTLLIPMNALNSGGRSLAFVIDVTASMQPFIDAVRRASLKLFERLVNEPGNTIESFILVSFNDPALGPCLNTTSKDAFTQALASLTAGGDASDDCPEPSMNAIRLALEAMDSNSAVFFFSDATSKDYKRYEQAVVALAQQKQAPIFFVITGACVIAQLGAVDPFEQDAFQTYVRVAVASSGFVFIDQNVGRLGQVVESVFEYYHLIMKSYNVYAITTILSTFEEKTIDITVGSQTDSVAILVRGLHPTCTMQDSNGKAVQLKVVADYEQWWRLWQAQNTAPGKYTVKVTYVGPGAIRMTGQIIQNQTTSFNGIVLFSKRANTTATNERAHAFAGSAVFAALLMHTDSCSNCIVNTMSFVDEWDSRKLSLEIPLSAGEQTNGSLIPGLPQRDAMKQFLVFYTVYRIVIPDVRFRVQIKGTDGQGKPFERTTTQSIEPLRPSPCHGRKCQPDVCRADYIRTTGGKMEFGPVCEQRPIPPQTDTLLCPQAKVELAKLQALLDEVDRNNCLQYNAGLVLDNTECVH